VASRVVRQTRFKGFGSLAVLVVDDLQPSHRFPTQTTFLTKTCRGGIGAYSEIDRRGQTALAEEICRVCLTNGRAVFLDAAFPSILAPIPLGLGGGTIARPRPFSATQQLEFPPPRHA